MYHQKVKHGSIHHSSVNHSHVAEKTEQRSYFWIWAESNGRHIVWGPKNTFEEANRLAASKLNVEYEIVELKTRDESQASRMLRARLLNDSGDIDNSFRRFSHK